MKNLNKLIFTCLVLLLLPQVAQSREVISLKGEWKLYLDAENKFMNQMLTIPFSEVIQLPGTLDEAQKGSKAAPSNDTRHLLRKYSYYGKAWYQREVEIPKSWRGCEIEFSIERTRPTHVFVDGQAVGECKLISAPQVYNLTKRFLPGKHTITVVVDNGTDCGLPKEVGSSHLWSDETQTIWNGMLGKIELTAKPKVFVAHIRTEPNLDSKSVKIDVTINNDLGKNTQKELMVSIGTLQKKQVAKLTAGINKIHISLPLGENPDAWSEYHPSLYDLKVQLLEKGKAMDETSTTFGYRKFATQGRSFVINGTKTFLRGKHDACVFPQTGYAPMNETDWTHYFEILKNYGFNHVRFHSWCPPEAAFAVADKMGFYLQVELPFWGMVDKNLETPVNQFLLAEGHAILDTYGNHPSLVMVSSGNELGGEISALQGLSAALRDYDSRPLYTLGTSYHLGWEGWHNGDDYLATCRVGGENDDKFEPQVRSSFSFTDAVDGGILNASYPNSVMDFSKGTDKAPVPVISHETGQFQQYPDENDLKNYTGILQPQNFEIFVKQVKAKVGAGNYKKYFDAAAALSLICYKADMEMMRRTKDLGGFQMLDLVDYPGQGTAVVGILNADMTSKGIISAEEFHSRNNDVLPLWLSDNFTFYAGTELKSQVKVSNNSDKDLKNMPLEWQLVGSGNTILAKGNLMLNASAGSLGDAVPLDIVLPELKQAVSCKLLLHGKDVDCRNSYDVWIYPQITEQTALTKKTELVTSFSEKMVTDLLSGKNILFMPDLNAYPEQTIGGLFTSDYWNYSMFKTISENAHKPVSPGSMGLLVDTNHPIFYNFPTENHSNWQWWSIVKNSNPVILDSLRGKIHPVVETIDNVERLYFLGTMFECRVGKGKLFVCMSDLKNHLEYKENKQLYNALISYLNSSDFSPKDELTVQELTRLFTVKASDKDIQGVKNVSYE